MYLSLSTYNLKGHFISVTALQIKIKGILYLSLTIYSVRLLPLTFYEVLNIAILYSSLTFFVLATYILSVMKVFVLVRYLPHINQTGHLYLLLIYLLLDQGNILYVPFITCLVVKCL